MKKAHIELTKYELEILLFILDDWRDIKSDTGTAVNYPSNAITSTQLIRLLNDIYAEL